MKSYTWEIPSRQWTFDHGGGYPPISAYRVVGEEVKRITPIRIEYTDCKTINIFFDTPIRGFVQIGSAT